MSDRGEFWSVFQRVFWTLVVIAAFIGLAAYEGCRRAEECYNDGLKKGRLGHSDGVIPLLSDNFREEWLAG